MCVCVCVCVAKWLKHLTVNQKITGSSPTSYHWRIFLHLAPNPGPSETVNWEPTLGWGRTRPLAVPRITGDHTTVKGHSSAPVSCFAKGRPDTVHYVSIV